MTATEGTPDEVPKPEGEGTKSAGEDALDIFKDANTQAKRERAAKKQEEPTIEQMKESIEEIDAQLESIGMDKPVGVPYHNALQKGGRSLANMNKDKLWRKGINSMGTEGRREKLAEMQHKGELTGIPELDEVFDLDIDMGMAARKDTFISNMWGCRSCWRRGTAACPHGIGKTEMHPNGICSDVVQDNLFFVRAMKSPNGMKAYRNLNIKRTTDLLEYYRTKLLEMRKSKGVGETELKLLDRVEKMQDKLNKRIEGAIRQDEGTKSVHVSVKPSDINKALRRAHQKVKDVDVEEDRA